MAIISGSSAEGGKPWGEGNARPPGSQHQIPAGDVIPTLRRLYAALKGWERSEGDGGGERSLLIQSGDPRIRSSDKSLSNREFATSAVGKNDAIVGGCRGQQGQKR